MSNLIKQLEKAKQGEDFALSDVLSELKFNEAGLIPAIAQQHDSKEILMMAWMNIEAIQETLQTKRVCYWSRSRKCLWRKGETSGNVQELVEFNIDCDADTLLLLVNQTGPACHTGRLSCFYNRVEDDKVLVTSDEMSG